VSSRDELEEFCARFRAEHAGAPLGPIADRVLLENDRVRIWEMQLEPGQASALHRHDLDYMLIILDGDRIAGVPGPGRTRSAREASVEPGQVFFLGRGETEWAVNRGTRPYREIIVELKD
jgi:beta-alanine degradation protein BauB